MTHDTASMSGNVGSLRDVGVLVPGAAGSAAIGAIKSLRRHGFPARIVSFDGEQLSGGFALSDVHYMIPTITQPDAYRRVLDILERESIKVILPTSASATSIFSKQKATLARLGVVFAGADGDVVDLCDDKLAFWQAVHRTFPVPALVKIRGGLPETYPCFVKPRFGSGSVGAGICRNEVDWRYLTADGAGYLLQEYLPGPEYSVDVLCDLQGRPLVAVPRERLSIIEGVTVRARVAKSPVLERMCMDMARHLDIKGTCCMQLKTDAAGQLRFLEVNARLGGSSIIATLAGVNIPACLVLMALGQAFKVAEFDDMLVCRILDEIVMPVDTAAGQPTGRRE
jgi:carbamoyl-phosphate synthase large subunit